MSIVIDKLIKLNTAQKQLAQFSTREKNEALSKIGETILDMKDIIIEANKLDIENARKDCMKEGLIDRLVLDNNRVYQIVDGISTVIDLKDPVWQTKDGFTVESGLDIIRVSVPLGVIGIIYESRPNVTVDAFALAFKAGSSILLRGSSSAINSNKALVQAIKKGLLLSNKSEDFIEFIESKDRDLVLDMLRARGLLDLVIPRGGGDLIRFVVDNAMVPTLETGEGNVHIYVDESADLNMALSIVLNAKTQRVGVCNAVETLLVNKEIALDFLPKLYNAIKDKVELRGCEQTRNIIAIKPATENDYQTEFLDFILAIKIVDDTEKAIEHINKYSTHHSEVIITNDLRNAKKFQKQVDSACVYVNASTRFTDGSEFGFGAEMGISTQKIHARGPVGLEQLVTYKYLINGNGNVRE